MAERDRGTKVAVAGHIESEVNRYYVKVSRRFMAAGIILLLLLLAYIVCVTMFFGEYVTYDNLKYLVRDFDSINLSGGSDFTKIVYNGNDKTDFTFYKNGLSMANSDGYRYYDNTGVMLAEEELGYSSPIMASSNKYMLVYDLGGKGYSVFNQLTRIIKRESDGEIIAGAIADDGSFIIASRSNETRYVAELYNSAFSNVMSVYKENFILDTAISPDGKTVAICSACPSGSDFDCEIEICRRGSDKPVRVMTIDHSMPLDVYASEDGFAVLCSTKIVFVGYDGTERSSVTFDGMNLKYADMNENVAAIVGSTNALGNENRVVIIDTKEELGKKLLDTTLKTSVRGVYAARESDECLAYLKLPDSAASLKKDGTLGQIATEGGEILTIVPMRSGVLICGRSSAYRAFEDKK